MIPPFEFETTFLAPWQEDWSGSLLIVLMGFFTACACGWVGVWLLLRRMALMGDAVSHSLLPGIVIAFFLAGSRATGPLFLGAVAVGLLTVFAVEAIHQNSRIKADAAMGITFAALFALGVLMVTTMAAHIDLDADCVLYGELVFVPLADPVSFLGLSLGTVPVARMGGVLLALGLGMLIFYRPLLITTFDAGLARSLGLNPRLYHYGLMTVLSIVIVSGFEAVGAILVIAMLILPGATALLMTERLPWVFFWTTLLAALYALLGFHLDVWLNATTAGAMVSVALLVFLVVWAGHLLLRRWRQRAARPTFASPLTAET